MKKLNQINENNVRSLIEKDRKILMFFRFKGINKERFVSAFIKNYNDFDSQSAALGESRKYRRIAKSAEKIGIQQSEKFFYENYGTRDLVARSDFDQDAFQMFEEFNLDIELELLDANLKELQQPPPIKNSMLPTVNLSARLLPAPTLTSA